MTRTRDTVAFLGTGTMGLPMARNLARAGFEVRAWNRSPDKAKPLEQEGATVAGSPAEAVRDAGIVVTMLSDAEAVLDVVERNGAFEEISPDAVWAQMSTIGVHGIEHCIEIARERGIELVDAPVLGTKQPAEEGQLTVLASGPPAAIERCMPLFDAVAGRIVRLGVAGEGTRLKLVLNAWIVSLVESLAETIALAEELGVDPDLFMETIEGGALDVQYAHLKGRMMVERSFPASFKLSLSLKDARLVRDAAADAGLELPLIEAVEQQFARAVDAGHGDEDLAAAFAASAPRL